MMDAVIALGTLTAMEIVLGIDNVVFIAILVARVKANEQERARKLGLIGALLMRLGLLFSISWVMGLTEPLFSILSHGFTGRDLILLAGGLFLIAKATFEIHEKLEAEPTEGGLSTSAKGASFGSVIVQIMLLDIVFSLDSVITAVGMAKQVWVMVAAMLLAMGVMLLAAKSIGDFVHKHPTIKILALSFLLLIGVMLLVEGMGGHVEKGYIYFAMAFSLLVEILNMRYRKAHQRVTLHEPHA